MSAEQTICDLLAAAGHGCDQEDAGAQARKAARVARVKDTVAALRRAQRRADQAWERMLAALPDDPASVIPDKPAPMQIGDPGSNFTSGALPEPPEQAELDAIHAQIRAVIDHDRWPRELYFGCL